ncbi:MAG TPA: EamA family transporter [Propionibacteriaceae bacterium]|nr:EamA family transporter [Propionibacteriaceae bacterium]
MTTAVLTRERIGALGLSAGLLPAVVSAAAFGLSGSLARSLLDLGWSPAAVVAARVGGAFLALLLPCLLLLRRIGLPSTRQSGRMVAYGLIAVALAQLCYFSSVQYLSIGVALLLEYLAPVLLIGWHWALSRRRPAPRVFVGAGLALAGLVLVLDLTGKLNINPVGVAWGLGAAACLCAYFLLSETGGGSAPIHPLLLTTASTGVGGLAIILLGVTGLLPLTARTGQTLVAGHAVSWLLPVALLILITAVLAYLTGIAAIRVLGSSVASFVALSEVIFAVIFAALLLSQHPSLTQLVGGALILIGIAVVQRGEAVRTDDRRSAQAD